MQIIPIQELSDQQIAPLARLHHCYVESLLKSLGLPFLDKYYRCARNDSSVTGFCAISEDGQPAGWVLGSSDPQRLLKQLRHPGLWFLWQLSVAVARRPGLLRQLLASSTSATLLVQERGIELLYFGVAPAARQQGVGTQLMDAFLRAAAHSSHTVTLSVEKGNCQAMRFYRGAGFYKTRSITEGKYRRQRMEYDLRTASL